MRAERNAEEFARSSFIAREVKVVQERRERRSRVRKIRGRREAGGS